MHFRAIHKCFVMLLNLKKHAYSRIRKSVSYENAMPEKGAGAAQDILKNSSR